MPSGIRNVIILLSILTLVLIGVSIYVGLELNKEDNVDSKPVDASNTCGNNICDADETCDGIEQCIGDATYVVGDCRNNCSYCGDNIVQSGEECDDGNDNTTDECTNACKLPQSDNATPTPTPTPTQSQIAAQCGNAQCDAGESCDGSLKCTGNGNFNSTSSCRLNCTYCGDGTVQTGEECDDNNTNNNDTCTDACFIQTTPSITPIAGCGDGVIQSPEECDPGISSRCSNGLACRVSDCKCTQSDPAVQDSKVCGEVCTSTNDCAGDNVCENGKCILLACSTTLGGLQGNINQSNNPNTVCSNDGCSLVQCGSVCAVNRQCPNGLTCNSNNQCVFTYCINNQCTNQCTLPATALESEDMKLILQALIIILLGLVAYQILIVNNSFSLLGIFSSWFVIKSTSKTKVQKKENSRFESNF